LIAVAGIIRHAEVASSSLAPSTNSLQQFTHFLPLARGRTRAAAACDGRVRPCPQAASVASFTRMLDAEKSARTPFERVMHAAWTGTAPAIEGIGATAVRASALPLSFLIQWMAARQLGAAGYGQWQALIATIDLLAFAGTLGLNNAGIRVVAEYRQRALWPLLNGLHVWVLGLGIGASMLLGGIWLVANSTALRPWPQGVVVLACALLATSVALELATFLLRGHARHILAAALLHVMRHLGVLAVLGVSTLLLVPPPALAWLIAAQVFTTTIAAAVATVALVHAIPRALRRTRAYDLAAWLHVSAPLWIAAASAMVQVNAGLLIVQRLAPAADVGAFAAAQRIAGFVGFGTILITLTAAPRIAIAHAARNRREVGKLVGLTTRVSVGGGTLLALAIVLISKPLLGSLGSEFAAQPSLLLVLVLAAWMACWSQGAIAALSMAGGERPLAAVLACLTMSFLALTYWGVRTAGVAGAANAAAVNAAFSQVALLTLYYSWRRSTRDGT
jgi:O-antigen/teichoic acid export membrane protein